LSYILPNGKGTVGDWLIPQIDKAYESGKMPRYCEDGDSMRTCGNHCWLKEGITVQAEQPSPAHKGLDEGLAQAGG
jgi:hypothetical protein